MENKQQYVQVASMAGNKKPFDVVFLRNGVIFASNGYVLSCCKFPSNIIMTTMIAKPKFFKLDELDGNALWGKCEGEYLSASNALWDYVIKKTLHVKGKAVTIHTQYLKRVLDLKSETFTLETDGHLSPIVIISKGVKSVIMPIAIDNDSLEEFKIGSYE